MGGSYGVGDSGGANSVTLTSAQMPSHYHFAFSSGNVGHLRNTSNLNSGNHPVQWYRSSNLNEAYNISAGYTPNVGRTSNTGSSTAHENRPPYYALCFIMKT